MLPESSRSHQRNVPWSSHLPQTQMAAQNPEQPSLVAGSAGQNQALPPTCGRKQMYKRHQNCHQSKITLIWLESQSFVKKGQPQATEEEFSQIWSFQGQENHLKRYMLSCFNCKCTVNCSFLSLSYASMWMCWLCLAFW